MSELSTNQKLKQKESKKRQRERWIIFGLMLMVILLTGIEYKLTRISSSLPFVNSIFFFGLINFNIILLIALLWLIFKNVGKLFFERRSRVLGSRLKTKLVTAFIGFSIIPTLTLFLISVLYINQSFDKWFSLKIQNTLQSSLEISGLYYKNAESTATHFADLISKQVYLYFFSHRTLPPKEESWLKQLELYRQTYALNAIELYRDPIDTPLTVLDSGTRDLLPHSFPRLPLDKVKSAFSGNASSFIQNIGHADLVRSIAPIVDYTAGRAKALIVVSVIIPVNLTARTGEITSVAEDYRDTNPLQYPIKTTYLIILILITLLIVFAEIWLGLYLARELTVPVERLVKAAHDVGQGKLDITLERVGNDEISTLVDSFNKMTSDLKNNQQALNQRSQELEAIIANIAAGILLLDTHGHILTANQSAIRFLGIQGPLEGLRKCSYTSVFSKKELEPLSELIELKLKNENPFHRTCSWTSRIDEDVYHLSAIATPLIEHGQVTTVLVVIDDLTFLAKGQREVAWREVAKRIAHEIKNPLTPIKLSAQRLQKRLRNIPGKDGQLVTECTQVIIQHTDELKEMVNEFSNFARFPEITPSPHQLNDVIQDTLKLYSSAHPEIHFVIKLDPRLPIFEFDKEQMRRVLLNLLDNAINAIKNQNPKPLKPGRIEIESHYNDILDKVAISLRDNGPGMDEETQSRAFEPYFSTKSQGSGLGLAIVKRIISDHSGYIRVHSALNEGTIFTIELPSKIRIR